MTKIGWTVIIVLGIVIAVLSWLLFKAPAPVSAPMNNGNATTTPPSATKPFESENVRIETPRSGARVAQTFTVTGEARGLWYFEASFPVQVRDANDNVLATVPAQAIGEWMTTEFVPFSTTITISGGYSGPATLVLLKDNPSGLPEHDDSVSIPIIIE
ncbi:MAG: hypothetical protein UY63_C0005G0011 [Parcubacteria group bacterium GW2011_GWA2_51_10]|nr:MAG: hypothetical protein UY63_C0005G0011 [Parcubacteria group bacterium GW2011_GWA2_51_10]